MTPNIEDQPGATREDKRGPLGRTSGGPLWATRQGPGGSHSGRQAGAIREDEAGGHQGRTSGGHSVGQAEATREDKRVAMGATRLSSRVVPSGRRRAVPARRLIEIPPSLMLLRGELPIYTLINGAWCRTQCLILNMTAGEYRRIRAAAPAHQHLQHQLSYAQPHRGL